MKRVIPKLILISFLLAGYTICNSSVKTYREELPAENERAEALMVSPTFLKVITGEFRGLWADYLLLKASIFLGGYHKSTPEDWDVIYLLFKQSLTLDPYFFQTCYYTQAFLAWRETMHEKAIDLLEVCAESRYWDWEPSFFVGFDYYYFLNNNKEASRYLLEAAQLPDAPPLMASLGARLAQKAGRTEDAIVLMQTMHERSEEESVKKTLKQRIEALVGVLILEKGIARFKTRFGRPPEKLDNLVTAGILNRLPINPYNKPYTYEDNQIGF